MYLSHWGLRASPFRGRGEAGSFVRTAVHDEALARLEFLAADRRRLGLVLGPAGVGKSLLLHVYAAQLRRQGALVVVQSLAAVDGTSFVAQAARELGAPSEAGDPPLRAWRKIADHLVARRYQQADTLFLLDDADRAERDTLGQVLRLLECDPAPDARHSVVLAAGEDSYPRIGAPLLERVELRIDLYPLDLAETRGYLAGLLARAGCARPIFEPAAIEQLHAFAQGCPRKLNQLADLCLLAGAGERAAQVGAALVERAYDELSVPVSLAPRR